MKSSQSLSMSSSWGSTFCTVPAQDLLQSPFNFTHEPSLNYRKHNRTIISSPRQHFYHLGKLVYVYNQVGWLYELGPGSYPDFLSVFPCGVFSAGFFWPPQLSVCLSCMCCDCGKANMMHGSVPYVDCISVFSVML